VFRCGSRDSAPNGTSDYYRPRSCALTRELTLRKAVKHHWYGETSPWTEQRAEDYNTLNQLEATVADAVGRVVIFDKENPPRSGRVAQD